MTTSDNNSRAGRAVDGEDCIHGIFQLGLAFFRHMGVIFRCGHYGCVAQVLGDCLQRFASFQQHRCVGVAEGMCGALSKSFLAPFVEVAHVCTAYPVTAVQTAAYILVRIVDTVLKTQLGGCLTLPLGLDNFLQLLAIHYGAEAAFLFWVHPAIRRSPSWCP